MVEHVCCCEIYGRDRMLTVWPANEDAVVITIGRHDESVADVYSALLDPLELEVPDAEREKLPCCDDAGRGHRRRTRCGRHCGGSRAGGATSSSPATVTSCDRDRPSARPRTGVWWYQRARVVCAFLGRGSVYGRQARVPDSESLATSVLVGRTKPGTAFCLHPVAPMPAPWSGRHPAAAAGNSERHPSGALWDGSGALLRRLPRGSRQLPRRGVLY